MKHDAETVERVAKAAAFAIRQPNDVSTDETEYWEHTDDAAKHTWMVAIGAALSAMPPRGVSVQEARSLALIEASEHATETAKSWRDNGFRQAALALFDEAKLLRALSEGKV